MDPVKFLGHREKRKASKLARKRELMIRAKKIMEKPESSRTKWERLLLEKYETKYMQKQRRKESRMDIKWERQTKKQENRDESNSSIAQMSNLRECMDKLGLSTKPLQQETAMKEKALP